jgi:hypothetical protein
MRALDVDVFEFRARANIQDFDRLAGFEQSFEFEWLDCFHISFWLKHNEQGARTLILSWLLLVAFCGLPSHGRGFEKGCAFLQNQTIALVLQSFSFLNGESASNELVANIGR